MSGCARAPIRSLDQAMRPVSETPALYDDMEFAGLAEALEKNILRLQEYRAVETELQFGPVRINKEIYISSLAGLLQVLKDDPTGATFLAHLNSNFEFYEVYGQKNWGDVFVTSYYEPILKGSLTRTSQYTQPLYAEPKDLVKIRFTEFARVFPDLKPVQNIIIEKSRDGVLRGRLDDANVLPYYSREEIDTQGVLNGQADVICYLDPVDAFFLQIQGSGVIEIVKTKERAAKTKKRVAKGKESVVKSKDHVVKEGQTIRVGYAAQNGHPYRAVGQFLFDVIPKEEMTAQKIKDHLRSLSSWERQQILNKNPSYVFMKPADQSAVTFFGAEAVAGRTIATDSQYFPKGSLALLIFDKPTVESNPMPTQRVTRFVLDQDIGGAIRGPGRVDLFWGRGDEAAQFSGVMRNSGRLYYILPKNRAL